MVMEMLIFNHTEKKDKQPHGGTHAVLHKVSQLARIALFGLHGRVLTPLVVRCDSRKHSINGVLWGRYTCLKQLKTLALKNIIVSEDEVSCDNTEGSIIFLTTLIFVL